MKIFVNLITFMFGFILMLAWLKLSIFIMLLLFTGCFILSILSIFTQSLKGVEEDAIKHAETWLKLPLKILKAYEH